MTAKSHDAERQAHARRAIDALYATDRASQANGMQITATGAGTCTVRMTVREDMTNGHGTCHGGMLFLLADSAFAFACNSDGQPTVAASAAIEFLAAARSGDELTAVATEAWRGGRSGIYDVHITNQKGERIALFRGRSHRLSGAPAKTGERE